MPPLFVRRKNISFFLVILLLASFLIGYLIFNNYKNSQNRILSGNSSVNPYNYNTKIKVGNSNLTVEIADTEEKRSLGLSGRKSMNQDNGMLFVWGKEVYPTFWMKDMHFALDIIWIDQGKVVGLNENVPPVLDNNSQMQLYPAPAVVDMVLEVNAGFTKKYNIQVGDNVDFSNVTK